MPEANPWYKHRMRAIPTGTFYTKTGATLIEVMIAMAVMAIAVSAIFSSLFTIDSLRTSSLARAMQTIAINNMVNLIEGTNWDELGRAQRPWSLSRIMGGGSQTLPPLTLSDFLGLNLVASEHGLFIGAKAADASTGYLRFYIEYYRSTANLDAAYNSIASQPGLIDTPSSSPAGFAQNFAANAATCRIVPDPIIGFLDSTLLTPGNPLMVRLVVVNVDPADSSQRVLQDNFLGVGTAPP